MRHLVMLLAGALLVGGCHGIAPKHVLRPYASLSALQAAVNADSTFTLARHGSVVRSFDPVVRASGETGRPLPEERGLQFGATHPTASSFVLLQRLTGITLTAKVFDEPSGRIGVGLKG